jgi:xanthine dehydrogenase accessory factor
MPRPVDLIKSLLDHLESGIPCALCTVVGTKGSTPQTAGAMLLVRMDGRTEGTIGGGCVEAEVRRQALKVLGKGASQLLSFVLDSDYGWDDGLICGGRLDVAVVSLTDRSQAADYRATLASSQQQEVAHLPLQVEHEGEWIGFRVNIEPTPTLLIAGAGHVGTALARLTVDLNFRVVVLDDRQDLLDQSRLPDPIESAHGSIQETLQEWPIDSNTYVVTVTRGHRHDARALFAVVTSPAKYVGMIGSRRKIGVVFDELQSQGVGRAKLDRVHTPIGLEIGAETVQEIAISIAAELVQIRRRDAFKMVEGPFEVDRTVE